MSIDILHDRAVTHDSPGAETGLTCVYPVPCVLHDGSVVCVYRRGSTKHSRDGALVCRRSTDRGATWGKPVPIFDRMTESAPLSVHAGAIGQGADGSLVAVLTAVTARRNTDSYIFSAQGRTLEQQLYVVRSSDKGGTWEEPEQRTIPGVTGNCYVGTRPHLLPSGELLLVLETTGGEGQETVIATTLSPDDLRLGAVVRCMEDPTGRLSYGDGRCIELDDGRLLLLAWTFPTSGERTLPPHGSVSRDGGRSWSLPRSTGASGQVISPLNLGKGWVIAATNVRTALPGIRLRFSNDGGETFRATPGIRMWDAGENRIIAQPLSNDEEGDLEEAGIWDDLPDYTFGYPDLQRLDDGSILLTYYAVIDTITQVRACRFRIEVP